MASLDTSSQDHPSGNSVSTATNDLAKHLAAAQQKQRQQASQIQHLIVEHEKQLRQVEQERDQLIQSLMESEERYRAHISATMAVIWHSNGAGEFCVPQHPWQSFTGQAWPDHQGTKWIGMLPTDEHESFWSTWQHQIQVGAPFTIECQIWSAKDAEYRHCEISATPMVESTQDSIHAWVGSVVDIHERKLTEALSLSTSKLLDQTVAELQRSNMELERFVYIASHDLKEPLRGMQNLATMVKDLYAHKLDDEGIELLTMIYQSGNRMHELISDLHNYSRVQLSSDGIQNVEPDQILDDIITELQMPPKQAPFTVSRPTRLPTLRCNPTHLQTIFKNLLSNALKYRKSDSANIEVGLLAPSAIEQDRKIFYVRDNGIGIAAKNHTIIFEMFKRLHVESEYGGGTGAGLALVKKILEQYGGEVWVDSAPSQGSTFYFTFDSTPDTPSDAKN